MIDMMEKVYNIDHMMIDMIDGYDRSERAIDRTS
jgi:hypothetical protein